MEHGQPRRKLMENRINIITNYYARGKFDLIFYTFSSMKQQWWINFKAYGPGDCKVRMGLSKKMIKIFIPNSYCYNFIGKRRKTGHMFKHDLWHGESENEKCHAFIWFTFR